MLHNLLRSMAAETNLGISEQTTGRTITQVQGNTNSTHVLHQQISEFTRDGHIHMERETRPKVNNFEIC
jgi:hypothetical protein